jgi:hypothetical protein
VTVYAPYVNTYASRTPYITPDEYKASPTGVNVSQLVPRGTPEQNDDALVVAISRASSYVDIHCRQVLAATLDTQSGRYRVQRGGFMRIPADNAPVVAVDSVKFGFVPSNLTTITDLSNIWIDRKVVTVPIPSVRTNNAFSTLAWDGRVYAVMTYVNGYANTLISANTAIGDTTITVDSTLGIIAGMELTIYDPGSTEVVTITNVAGNVLTVSAPMSYAHEIGDSISALPSAIKQAVVLLTSAIIKTRGSEAIVMNTMSQPTVRAKGEAGMKEEITMAKELLVPFVRPV